MMLVGLCGRSGSGKGYISKIFADYGIPSIDTDAVYRNMTGPGTEMSRCMAELVSRFGERVRASDGSLDRSVMREIVFNGDGKALADLNAITHKHILYETMEIARALCQNGNDIILVDAPLLYESGFDKICERVVCVTAPEEVILARIIKRDGLSESDAKKRLAVQTLVKELEAKADYVIENNDDKAAILSSVEKCAKELKRIYKEKYL